MGIKKDPIADEVWRDDSTGDAMNIVTEPNTHVKILHGDAAGFIALFSKWAEGRRQWHYRREEITAALDGWSKNDTFISVNTFYTPKRLQTNLKEIRAQFVDIDCYNAGMTAEAAAVLLQDQYFGKVLPPPNFMIYSGRGLNLIWLIRPMSGLAIDRWDHLQRAIFKTVESIGADSKALDAARVFRISGTYNTKSGRQVYGRILHDHIYTHEEILEQYFPKLNTRPARKKAPKKAARVPQERSGSVAHLFTDYSLVKTRMEDVERLVTLRSGEMPNCREYALFLYRYWCLATYQGDEERAAACVLELNSRFSEPLPEREALGDTKSAERYYKSEEPFRITNRRVIEWLKIQPEEERWMHTIISRSEKRRRDAAYQQAKRREQGAAEREQYEAARAAQKAKKVDQLADLMDKHPKMKQKEIAEIMGVSPAYVSQLKKLLLKN